MDRSAYMSGLRAGLRKWANPLDGLLEEAPASVVAPAAIGLGGLGATGAGVAANVLSRAYKPVNPDLMRQEINLFRGLSGPQVPASAFPYLYSELGHKLVNTPVTVFGKPTRAGVGVLRLRAGVQSRLAQLMGIKEDQAGQLGNLRASLEHYRAFGKSPLAGYRQLIGELPMASSKVSDLRELTAKIMATYPRERWNAELSRAIDLREHTVTGEAGLGFVNKIRKRFGRPVKQLPLAAGEFDPYFSSVLRRGGIEDAGRATPVELERAAQRAFAHIPESYAGGRPILLGGHMAERFADIAKHYPEASWARLMDQPTPVQSFLDAAVTGRMRKAPANYLGVYDLSRLMRGLGHPLVIGGALGTGVLGLLTAARRKKQREEQWAWLPRAMGKSAQHQPAGDVSLAYPALGALGLMGSTAYLGGQFTGPLGGESLRKINPFAKPSVSVLGGTEAGGSFSHQAKAWEDALRSAGMNTVRHPLYTVRSQYTPSPDVLRSHAADAVLQVGAHPLESALAMGANRGDYLRYRALTDMGAGNFNQPEQWLGGRNWMRVHDDPKSYTRFFVPGGDVAPLPAGVSSAKAPVNIPTIPTSKLFHGLGFIPPQQGARPLAAMTMGGGAGGFLLFPDIRRMVDGKEVYDPRLPNIVDRTLGALREKHGPNFDLHLFLGGKVDDIKRSYPAFGDFIEAMATDQTGRYRGLKLHSLVPQAELADVYRRADYLLQLPGSTSAELMAMGGRPGKVINVIPNELLSWMPRHFSVNAKMVEHTMPGAVTVGIGPDSAGDLRQAIMAGRESMAATKPLLPDIGPAVKAIGRDVRNLKLRRLLRVGGAAGIGAAGLYGLLSGARKIYANRKGN